jgi:6,7-dimethyl-8-ribityllumazine synthase
MNQHSRISTGGAQRIAFIQSDWHSSIVDCARKGFVARLAEAGVGEDLVDFFVVPGAFEIPLKAKRLAATGRYGAIVAAGLVVNGGIYRHEFVAEAVISGLMRVQLDTDVPVLSAVLTPHHFHDHEVHQTFFAEHFVEKGREVANACLAVTDPVYAVA